jgi:hypothetical protein
LIDKHSNQRVKLTWSLLKVRKWVASLHTSRKADFGSFYRFWNWSRWQEAVYNIDRRTMRKG